MTVLVLVTNRDKFHAVLSKSIQLRDWTEIEGRKVSKTVKILCHTEPTCQFTSNTSDK